jgi:hypothetical protein
MGSECRVGDCMLAGRFKRVTWVFVGCRVCGLRYRPQFLWFAKCQLTGLFFVRGSPCKQIASTDLAGGLVGSAE